MATLGPFAGRRPQPRGSIAVLAGLGLPVMLILMAGVSAYAFLSEGRRRLENATDALALTYAEQGLVVPQQYWAKNSFAPSSVAVANGLESGSFALDGAPTITPEAGPGRNQPDAWAPAFFQVHTTYSKPALGLGSLITAFIGNPVTSFDQYSHARVNQLHLSNFLLARERVMFVLDYSKSMRLNYEGSGASSGLSGLDVMRSTGAQVISNFQGVFDVGLLLFSDGGSSPGTTEVPSQLLKPASGSITQADQNAQIDKLTSSLTNTGTMGNGTDISYAINTAASMLQLASTDTSSLFSNQRIILITDGEPDAGEGVGGASYDQQVESAIGRAKIAVNQAWDQGIMTDVVFMQRQQSDQAVGSRAEAFLKSIAGKKGSDANNYKGDAGDPEAISAWLQSLAVYPVCKSSRIDVDLTPNNVPRGLMPGSGELLRAYFEVGNNGYGQELVVGNIFFNDPDGFKKFIGLHGAVIAPDSKNVNLEALKNPDNLAIYYDGSPGEHTIYLSPMMCAALQSTQNNNKQMRLRLRWGSPRTVPPGELQVLR